MNALQIGMLEYGDC